MRKTDLAFYALLGLTTAAFLYLFGFVFFKAPVAQPEAGGLAQKIFYFHVPAAWSMYLCGTVCFAGSVAFLLKGSDRSNAIAEAAAECAVVFGLVVLTSGPLWAKKAWGIYWTWDPRLTTLLLSVVIYVAIVVLRAFSGGGYAERKFAAALGVLGTVNLPIIHYAVQRWGGTHPAVISKGGGGLKHPDMSHAFWFGVMTMLLFSVLLLWWRTQSTLNRARLQRVEEQALQQGILG